MSDLVKQDEKPIYCTVYESEEHYIDFHTKEEFKEYAKALTKKNAIIKKAFNKTIPKSIRVLMYKWDTDKELVNLEQLEPDRESIKTELTNRFNETVMKYLAEHVFVSLWDCPDNYRPMTIIGFTFRSYVGTKMIRSVKIDADYYDGIMDYLVFIYISTVLQQYDDIELRHTTSIHITTKEDGGQETQYEPIMVIEAE